ncbi:MAG TPA: peptidase C39 [Paraburkholderia sp.]|jgi:hypothetical protein
MNRYLSSHGVAAALCALALSQPGGASAAEVASVGGAATAPAFLSAGNAGSAGEQSLQRRMQWQGVGDDVLATQTGKYAGAEMISGFVLNLLSTWQLPSGAAAQAQGSLTVAQNAANQASAQVQTAARIVQSGSGTTAANNGAGRGANGDTGSGANANANANANASATGGQNVTVNGVSQITQVAGSGNVGSNSTQIEYSNNAAQYAAVSGGSASPSASATNASGTMKAAVAFANGGVTVALQTPAGLATQSIVPGNTQQAGRTAQLLQVAGNNQQVTNQLQLVLQTQQISGAALRQIGVLQALHNVH